MVGKISVWIMGSQNLPNTWAFDGFWYNNTWMGKIIALWFKPEQNLQHYHQTSNISQPLVGNNIFYPTDVVGAFPIGAVPTTSSFST